MQYLEWKKMARTIQIKIIIEENRNKLRVLMRWSLCALSHKNQSDLSETVRVFLGLLQIQNPSSWFYLSTSWPATCPAFCDPIKSEMDLGTWCHPWEFDVRRSRTLATRKYAIYPTVSNVWSGIEKQPYPGDRACVCSPWKHRITLAFIMNSNPDRE